MDELAQQAIQAAIKGDWHKAELLNRKIVQTFPDNLEGLLRLANAAAQLGKIKEAAAIYEKILKIDPHNLFANKGLAKVKNLKVERTKSSALLSHSLNNSFLEEPGKTKIITLVRPAYSEILARLDTGELVYLTPRRRRLCIMSQSGTYIGRLPDNISMRLLGLIKGGNQYQACIKSISEDHVKVFIREILRSGRFASTPSFPPETNFQSHSESE